jgi:CheY-like chemotaxis protein
MLTDNYSPRILYVEDHPLNLNIMRKMLRVMDYEFLSAADGQSGLLMAQRKLPHLILMDLFLPDMPGWEVTRQLKLSPITQHIPIVVLTSDTSHFAYQCCIDAGCDGYLNKPVSRMLLLKTIQQFLATAVETL